MRNGFPGRRSPFARSAQPCGTGSPIAGKGLSASTPRTSRRNSGFSAGDTMQRMERRAFIKFCAAAAAASGGQAAAADARPRYYQKAKLVDENGAARRVGPGQPQPDLPLSVRVDALLPAQSRQAGEGVGAPEDGRRAQLRMEGGRRCAALARRVLGDLRAQADLPDARHQLHQLPRREERAQQVRRGDPLLLGAQPVRSRRRRSRGRRAGAAAARRDPARARPGERRAPRGRHARRRAVQRVLRQVRVPPGDRARRSSPRGGHRLVRGAGARPLLPPASEVLAWLARDERFPPAERALKDPNGLLCAGGDLSLERLLDAYRHGIFPWYSGAEPVLWWSPDPRMVLYCDELKLSRSLGKSARNRGYRVTADQVFADVLLGCSEPRKAEPGTWLGKDMRKAYLALHRAGHAHSFETWRGKELVGGLYGVQRQVGLAH